MISICKKIINCNNHWLVRLEQLFFFGFLHFQFLYNQIIIPFFFFQNCHFWTTKALCFLFVFKRKKQAIKVIVAKSYV